jgi:hypothetical protein
MSQITTIKSPLEATKPDADWKKRLDYISLSGYEYTAFVAYTDHSDYPNKSVEVERIEITGNPLSFFTDWSTETLQAHIESNLTHSAQAA